MALGDAALDPDSAARWFDCHPHPRTLERRTSLRKFLAGDAGHGLLPVLRNRTCYLRCRPMDLALAQQPSHRDYRSKRQCQRDALLLHLRIDSDGSSLVVDTSPIRSTPRCNLLVDARLDGEKIQLEVQS